MPRGHEAAFLAIKVVCTAAVNSPTRIDNRLKDAIYRPYKKAGKADRMLIPRMRIAIRRWNLRVFVVPTAGASRDEKRVLIRQKRPSPATKTGWCMVKCGPSWPKLSP